MTSVTIRPRMILGLLACFGTGANAFAQGEYFQSNNLIPSPAYRAFEGPLFSGGGNNISVSHIMMLVLNGRVPAPNGTFVTATFDVSAAFDIDFNGTTVPGTASGTSAMALYTDAGPSGSAELYNTEMLSLNLTGSSSLGSFKIRESPTLASTGQTTIRPDGGGFMVNSFFDVFTELSLDGGQTWVPSSSGSFRMFGTPEPATLATLGVGAMLLLRRRRRT